MTTIQEETYAAVRAMVERNGYTVSDALRAYARKKGKTFNAASFAYYEMQRQVRGIPPRSRKRRKAAPPARTTIVAQSVPEVATPAATTTNATNGTVDAFASIGDALVKIAAELKGLREENRDFRDKLNAIGQVLS